MQRANNGGPSACASCKHQRKKCTSKCALAPFFPVDKTREFQAVHKVFGVSNVTKIVTSLNEDERKVAVDSLVWEALCRQKDPVLGPYGDYRRICEELRLYKSQQYHHHQGLMGWSNNNKLINTNNNNNNHNNLNHNNSNNNFHGAYGYSSHHIQDTAEKHLESSALILPQQHLANGFNQPFILAGQYNPLGSKSIESTRRILEQLLYSLGRND